MNYEKYLNAFKPSESLSDKHLNDWLKSGVDEKTARVCRTSVAGDSWVVFVWDLWRKNGFGFIARYDNEAIEENRYPNKEENETPKYRLSPELGNRFYYPPIKGIDWAAIAKDPTIDIGITEGIKKAVKLTLEGLPTIGLFGVYNWLRKPNEEEKQLAKIRKEEPKSQPIDDFNLFKWNKRRVTIFFDGDKWDKWNVLHAEARLWKYLTKSLHTDCRIANITKQFYEVTKAKGIDDVLALPKQNPKETLQLLLSRATTVPPGFAALKTEKGVNYDDIVYNIAKYLIEDYIFIGLKRGVFSFQKGYYKLIEDAHFIKHEAIKLLEQAQYTPSTHILSDISNLIPSICRIPGTKVNPENMHNVNNRILKLNLQEETIEFIEHNPDVIFTFMAEANYSADMDCSMAKQFLDSVMPDKDHQILFLEALSFSMFPALRQKMEYTKMIVMFGEGSNGKTILIGFCMRLIGLDAFGSTSLDQINSGDKFQASSLYLKRVNFSSENDATIIKETKILKAITSGKDGDMIDVEFKHVNPFKAKVCPILFVAVNKQLSLPADRTPALERRLNFIDFPFKFVDEPKPDTNERKKDSTLENKELTKPIVDGLLYLTVEAAKELIKRGKPWNVGVEEGVKEAALRGSHFERFIHECIEPHPEAKTPSKDCWDCYISFGIEEGIAEEFTDKHGNTKPVWHDNKYDTPCKSGDALTKKLLKYFKKQIKLDWMHHPNGKKDRAIKGIRLKVRQDDEEETLAYQENNPSDIGCTPVRQDKQIIIGESNNTNTLNTIKSTPTPPINNNNVAYWRTSPENTDLEEDTPTDLCNTDGVLKDQKYAKWTEDKHLEAKTGPTLPKVSEEDMARVRKAIKDEYKKVFGENP